MSPTAETADGSSHPAEPHTGSLGSRLNWLRAGVLGANDGIVSTAGIVVGVAGASSGPAPVLVAGVAAVVAGALSMGGGEYVSVSTQPTRSRWRSRRRRVSWPRSPTSSSKSWPGCTASVVSHDPWRTRSPSS